MPEPNLFLIFTMLAISPESILLSELEPRIAERGLQDAWAKVQSNLGD